MLLGRAPREVYRVYPEDEAMAPDEQPLVDEVPGEPLGPSMAETSDRFADGREPAGAFGPVGPQRDASGPEMRGLAGGEFHRYSHVARPARSRARALGAAAVACALGLLVGFMLVRAVRGSSPPATPAPAQSPGSPSRAASAKASAGPDPAAAAGAAQLPAPRAHRRGGGALAALPASRGRSGADGASAGRHPGLTTGEATRVAAGGGLGPSTAVTWQATGRAPAVARVSGGQRAVEFGFER